MTETLAFALFVLFHNIALATPAQQLAAWNAAPAQERAADVRQAQFVLSR